MNCEFSYNDKNDDEGSEPPSVGGSQGDAGDYTQIFFDMERDADEGTDTSVYATDATSSKDSRKEEDDEDYDHDRVKHSLPDRHKCPDANVSLPVVSMTYTTHPVCVSSFHVLFN